MQQAPKQASQFSQSGALRHYAAEIQGAAMCLQPRPRQQFKRVEPQVHSSQVEQRDLQHQPWQALMHTSLQLSLACRLRSGAVFRLHACSCRQGRPDFQRKPSAMPPVAENHEMRPILRVPMRYEARFCHLFDIACVACRQGQPAS